MAVRIENNAEPIPGYKLIERLGGGGFGDVWKVEAPGGLFKAMKFVFGDLQNAGEDGQRAEQELKAMSRVKTVRHPYILSLERFDIIDGQLIIVMELADRNLWDRFKECRSKGMPGIPREELLRYMAESAEALDLMNVEFQLQHLDIKPQNIFLVHNHVKVADFGLVKDLEGMAASVTGGVTPVYAAPETFDGWVSRYSDQYSLGIVYQELLTGQRPFAGNNVRQLILQHLQAVPNVAVLPPGDQPAILKALAKNPDERHASCMDLVRALQRGTMPASPETDVRPSETPTEVHVADTPGYQPCRPAPQTLKANAELNHSLTQPYTTNGDDGERTEPSRPPAPSVAEASGEGTLFPALVVALGDLGWGVLQSLRGTLQERFGALDDLPHLRLLYIDTDPEVLRTAGRGSAGGASATCEVLLARLNRPSHYLKPRDGRPQTDRWLDPQMLYRIPRTQETAGFRALGRLAFCDNYLAISRRLREDLEAITAPEAMAAAARHTCLGLRTNKPRVYVVSSFAGGTGGGMFLDLAYVARAILKKLSYPQAELIGLFLLPRVDDNPAHAMALGNAFAALTELNHFSMCGVFSAHYHERDAAIHDPAPPFQRTIVLPLPKQGDGRANKELAATAAEFLWRDLFTPLGRAADARRSQVRSSRGITYQSFGLFKICSPKRSLVRQVARRLCQEVIRHWVTKDASPVAAAVQEWVKEHWSRENYGPEVFIARLQESCEQALGKPPESAFSALLSPFTKSQEQTLDLAAIDNALAQLAKMLGQPMEESLANQPGAVEDALRKASEELVEQWGRALTKLTVTLIEDPAYRLAGAEEAIRQVTASLEQVLQHYETLGKELGNRAFDSYVRIHQLLDGLNRDLVGRNRIPATITEIRELLTNYPKWRYQQLIMRQLAGGYISLRGNLTDELREVGFCRARLGDLLKAFEAPSAAETRDGANADQELVRGRRLFNSGCTDLGQAVEQFLQTMTVERVEALHARVQSMIQKQFTALINICLGASNLVKNLETAMQQEVEAFVSSGPVGTGIAEVFLQQFPEEEEAGNELVAAFDEAVPDLVSTQAEPSEEFALLAVPPGPSGERILEAAGRALPDAKLVSTASVDDIFIYRELTSIEPANLEQLGPAGLDAYRQMTQTDHLTPHTRIDIPFGSA